MYVHVFQTFCVIPRINDSQNDDSVVQAQNETMLCVLKKKIIIKYTHAHTKQIGIYKNATTTTTTATTSTTTTKYAEV